jgi:phytoene dehydrogenase-like protein
MGRIAPEDAADEYDVIVAGGGLGGLTAANVLARRGWRVLLAEQHSQFGGLATWFRRKHHVFDVALHGFPVGMRKTLRKYWSAEMAERIVQVKSIRFDNPQFSLETTFTREDFTRLLTEQFKVPAATVAAFYDELEAMDYFDDRTRTNRELFEAYFPGRNDVVRLLMEPITYANGSTLDEPAITYGIVFSNFMSKGVYTFHGGTDAMLAMMEAELTRNGVDFCTKAPCRRVRVGGGRVTGAVIGEREIRCRAVLSNGNLVSTIREWVGEEHFRPEFCAKLQAVRLNHSSCQVYFGLRPGTGFEPVGDLLFTSTCPEFDPEALLARSVTSRTYSIYYPEIRPGGNDYTVVASMNARHADWAGMDAAEYRAAKDALVADTLAHLERYLPGIGAKLDHVEAATPRTFHRYTWHPGGSSFGTKFEGLDVSMKLPEELPGLYHAGSVGIIMSGWLGAANYGVIVAGGMDKYLDRKG